MVVRIGLLKGAAHDLQHLHEAFAAPLWQFDSTVLLVGCAQHPHAAQQLMLREPKTARPYFDFNNDSFDRSATSNILLEVAGLLRRSACHLFSKCQPKRTSVL